MAVTAAKSLYCQPNDGAVMDKMLALASNGKIIGQSLAGVEKHRSMRFSINMNISGSNEDCVWRVTGVLRSAKKDRQLLAFGVPGGRIGMEEGFLARHSSACCHGGERRDILPADRQQRKRRDRLRDGAGGRDDVCWAAKHRIELVY
jgi:hypothetical protein